MKIKFKVYGMTCMHCHKSVTDAISAVNGVNAVDVQLEDESATVDFDPNLTSLDTIKEAVIKAGYKVDEKPLSSENINLKTQKESISQEEQKKDITVNISGMHCASCASNIEKALLNLDGIETSSVNLPLGNAHITYRPSKITPHNIGDTIEALGYNVITESVDLKIEGMTCAACVTNVEKVLKKLNGVTDAVVNLSLSKAHVEYNSSLVSYQEMLDAINSIGYHATLIKETNLNTEILSDNELEKQKINLLIAVAFSIPVMLGNMKDMYPSFLAFVPDIFSNHIVLFLLTTIVMLIPGRQFFEGALKGLMHGVTDMNLLIATGTGAAYLISVAASFLDLGPGYHHLYYDTAVMLITFIILGRYMEVKARGKTSQAIKKLMNLQAKTAHVMVNDQEIEIPIEEVKVNDIVVVRPGEKLPVDGVIIDGISAVDESMITGESIPVDKKENDNVIGSTINKSGFLKFRATKIGNDTILAQIIKLVENAQTSKAPIQRIADIVAGYFISAVHVIALLAFIFWFFIGFEKYNVTFFTGTTSPFLFALLIAITVLVISCPCAVGLATPAAIMVGTGIGAEKGILIKGGEALENSQKIDTIVFDKTGTLTYGKPIVTDIFSCDNFNENELLQIAATAEQGSEHPLGKAIVQIANERKLELKKLDNFSNIAGHGITAVVNGENILLGTRKLMQDNEIEIDSINTQMEQFENSGKTAMILVKDKTILGIIAVADTVKSTSKGAIDALHKMGIKTVMLTGDNHKTAQTIANELGINKIIAQVLPEDKASEIKKLQKTGKIVAMVGDGINDAPALMQADIGIAMGAGTDIAMESAEIVLIKNDLNDVVTSINLSKLTIRKIKQNLFWAFGYNSMGIPLAAGVLFPVFHKIIISPEIAAIFMVMSSVSVTTNSLLMKRKSI